MAGIEKMTGKTGTVTWRVYWREGGGRAGRRDSETCDDHRTAKKFKALVEATGEQRPAGYPKKCRGIGIGDAAPQAPAGPPAAEAAPAVSSASSPSSVTKAQKVWTFGEVVDAYLAAPGDAEPRQILGYRRLFDQHVRVARVKLDDEGTLTGPLGGLPIDEVTAEVIQAWIVWMGTRTYTRNGTRTPYSAKTIHNIHGGVVSPALAWACRNRSVPITVNPCADVKLPKLRRRSVSAEQVPMGTEIATWVKLAYEVSELAGDLTTLAMGTGLRWSEMIALRPIDVDLGRRLLTVARAVKEDGQTRALYIAPYAKSDAALRTLRLPDSVVDMLARRIQDIDIPPRSLIFRAARGGIFQSSVWYTTHWSKVQAKAAAAGIGTGATAHKFRHAHATELLAHNVSLDTVSKRLGHESILVTSALYSHLTPEADQRAADLIDGVMNGARPTADAKTVSLIRKPRKPRRAAAA
jgi:integrase